MLFKHTCCLFNVAKKWILPSCKELQISSTLSSYYVVTLDLINKVMINQSAKLTTLYILWDWLNKLALFFCLLRRMAPWGDLYLDPGIK